MGLLGVCGRVREKMLWRGDGPEVGGVGVVKVPKTPGRSGAKWEPSEDTMVRLKELIGVHRESI